VSDAGNLELSNEIDRFRGLFDAIHSPEVTEVTT